MKRLIRLLIVILATVLPTLAKEGGDQYPNGAENWFAGVAPPRGLYFVNYFGYYTGELKDGSGNKVSLNGATPVVDATFDAFRFVEMTGWKIAGADYGVHVIVPVVYQTMNLNGKGSMSSVGDIIVNPLILGWHGEHWHAVTAVDVALPTGHFDQSDPRVCVGAHYYSFEPLLAFSYLPKAGWEASAKLMYNLKTTNQLTNYHSGQEFHVDYVAGRHVGPWLFGATGYAVKQLTDDTVNGQTIAAAAGMWDAGRRGQVLAVGPSIGYTSKRHMTFMAQWQHETLVRNRFGGDKIWFKMIIPIASLF
jgi:hypothetical protein